jgi:hypothetical protein
LGKHLHDGVPFWSPLDLLGLFLSSMGPAPVGATKRNFFLPMTAMFARWCRQLVRKGPFMSNCTWESENGPAKFFLGASLTVGVSLTGGSLDSFQSADGIWISVIQRERYKLMAHGERSAVVGWLEFQPLSPVGDQPEGDTHRKLCRMLSLSPSASVSSSSFESCLDIICNMWWITVRGYGGNNENVHGISLQYKGVRPPTYQDSLSGEMWRRVADPCKNCQELIRLHGGNVANFFRYAGSAGAPP